MLYAELGSAFHVAPFAYLARDADVEAVSSAGAASGWAAGRARGGVVSVDDAAMGWSRYAQSLSIAVVLPTLFYAGARAAAEIHREYR